MSENEQDLTKIYRETFYAIVPDADQKMWTLARGRFAETCEYASAERLKKLVAKGWGFECSVLVRDTARQKCFEGANLVTVSSKNLYWCGVWQKWGERTSYWAKLTPDILKWRNGGADALVERGIWSMPLGFNFSHTCHLNCPDTPCWHDPLELYAKPEMESEAK